MEESMSSSKNRVAIVTGAGRGIAREHALLLGTQGYAVVVNDLGGANDGSGSAANPAQHVADEIVAAGGPAVANTASVSSRCAASTLGEQSLTGFRPLDAVVN